MQVEHLNKELKENFFILYYLGDGQSNELFILNISFLKLLNLPI